jgi:hypothetical protein
LSFQLPKVVQRYFEGVSAKDNGEYSDDSKKQVSLNQRNRNATGWEENGEKREKDQPRLMRCKACNESSLDGRSIIQCDDCNAQWHLDCLDPPQANPPSVNNINRTRAFFRCPLHAENDMRLIGNPRLAFAEQDGLGSRGHKLRKMKRARVIKPIIQRGNRNNGYIEVELEEEEPIAQEDGVVYKLSETAVKLDFLEKAYSCVYCYFLILLHANISTVKELKSKNASHDEPHLLTWKQKSSGASRSSFPSAWPKFSNNRLQPNRHS